QSMHVVADRGFDSRLRLEVASRAHLAQCRRADDALSQLLGAEGLASTRRAIEDDLLLVLDDLQGRAFRCTLAVVVPSLDKRRPVKIQLPVGKQLFELLANGQDRPVIILCFGSDQSRESLD